MSNVGEPPLPMQRAEGSLDLSAKKGESYAKPGLEACIRAMAWPLKQE